MGRNENKPYLGYGDFYDQLKNEEYKKLDYVEFPDNPTLQDFKDWNKAKDEGYTPKERTKFNTIAKAVEDGNGEVGDDTIRIICEWLNDTNNGKQKWSRHQNVRKFVDKYFMFDNNGYMKKSTMASGAKCRFIRGKNGKYEC